MKKFTIIFILVLSLVASGYQYYLLNEAGMIYAERIVICQIMMTFSFMLAHLAGEQHK